MWMSQNIVWNYVMLWTRKKQMPNKTFLLSKKTIQFYSCVSYKYTLEDTHKADTNHKQNYKVKQ